MALRLSANPSLHLSPLKGREGLLTLAALVMAAPASAAPDPVLAAQLQAKTQTLVDAIAVGDKGVWDAALDPALTYVDENNKVMTKAQFLADLKPLPAGLSGQIRVANYQLNHDGPIAVATYIDDESLDYNGQLIRTKFRVTDSWMLKGKDWKLVASQTNAVPEDPVAATLPEAVLKQYAGQYELTYDIHYRIDVANGKIVGQRQGDPKIVELKAEVQDVLFTPGEPRTRKIFQRDAGGAVTGFVDRREGHDIVWKKVQ